MSRDLRKLMLSLAVPVLAALVGCSDVRVTEPVLPAPETASLQSRQGGPDLSHLATFRQRPSITIAWARKWIGPEGGRLEFQGFAVDVPAGAVDRVTQFSIRLPVDPRGSERVVAEFGPHGATFKRPVAIELPLAGTSIEQSSTRTIVWWNDGWTDMGGEPTADGARLRTETDHFSTYGTTSRRGGVLVSGG